MLLRLKDRITSVSLKWKLLCPFLVLAFLGTTSLVYVGLSLQTDMIDKEERQELENFFSLVLALIDHKREDSLAVAATIAGNPDVPKLLVERDRDSLVKLFLPLFQRLNKDYGVEIFHFHVPPGQSLLRLHRIDEPTEMITYRKTIMDAMKGGKGVAGLEWGVAGLDIRGVVPIYDEGRLAGTVEIGFPLDKRFVDYLKRHWTADFAVYEKMAKDDYSMMGASSNHSGVFLPQDELVGLDEQTPAILISPKSCPNRAVLLGHLKDYRGGVVALVAISRDRSKIMARLVYSRNLMIAVGLIGLILSFALTYFVAILFIRPIRQIVREAEDIAQEKREIRLAPGPKDEMGILTESLNTMLESLKLRRMEIENHARTLEKRVEQRTADLVDSEMKYRTLVENVPLIVYRVLSDGTTEFINSYLTETLGYSTDEAVSDRNFWREKMWGGDVEAYEKALATCFTTEKRYRMEREVKHKDGRLLTFIDHAIASYRNGDSIKWVDGIMMDITEL
ncbi:MAG: PAS domain S-box protein, partial [Deltaproteobacteria bacterium]|nr:PAS domain S-box protein [Deltaproteobacteria bacterium]